MTIAAVPNMNMDFIEYASEIGRIHGRIHEIRHELYSVHGGDCRVIGFYISDRKSTRLNSSHLVISYAVFCLKKKKIHSHTSSLSIQSTDSATAHMIRHLI